MRTSPLARAGIRVRRADECRKTHRIPIDDLADRSFDVFIVNSHNLRTIADDTREMLTPAAVRVAAVRSMGSPSLPVLHESGLRLSQLDRCRVRSLAC